MTSRVPPSPSSGLVTGNRERRAGGPAFADRADQRTVAERTRRVCASFHARLLFLPTPFFPSPGPPRASTVFTNCNKRREKKGRRVHPPFPFREKRFRRKVHAKEYYSSGSFYFTVLKIRRFLFSSWRKGKKKRKERKREENKTLERESNKLDREIVFTFEQSIHNKDVNFGYPILRSDPSELL